MRNGGKWTEGKFNSFIKSTLRAGSLRWEPRYTCLNEACTGKQINVKTGRLAKHYRCADCQQLFPAKDVRVDHIEAVIDPLVGFVSWDETINRLFCEKENLQVLCMDCHDNKTAAEKQLAKERKANDKTK